MVSSRGIDTMKWLLAVLACLVLMLSVTVASADMPAVPIRRLDDPTRVKVLAAVAALIILGFGMVLLTWLGARFAQHYRHGSAYFRPTSRPTEHDWSKTPLTSDQSRLDSPDSRPPTPDP